MSATWRRVTIACVAVAVLVAGALALRQHGGGDEVAPGWDTSDGRMAARVNDTTITEGEVTQAVWDYLQALGLTETDDLAGWLSGEGKTPATLRDEKLDALINDEVVRQAADELGVEVSDDDVAAEVERMRAGYVEGLTGSDDPNDMWLGALGINGYTEKSYEQAVRTQLTSAGIAKRLPDDTTYADWIENYYDSCDIERAPTPDDLPYL